MVSFGDLPFRRKLTVIIMATSSATVLLACVAFVTHDLLSSDLHEIRARFFRDLGIGALVLLVCSFAAWLLSSRLQRLVSEPVLQLVQTARAVSELKDFSVRARKEHDDELGLLVDAFNEMLDQTQQSLGRLESARRNLIDRTLEVERINKELARSNLELASFASVASHDLQEPLRKITAFGDRLTSLYGDELGERGRDYLQRMHGAAARMQSLIDDLLAYSRITTQAQPFAPVSLAQVTKEVLSDLELRLEKTGTSVEVGDLPTIDADPLQMRQLFQNLLSNALKFQRPGVAPRIVVQGRVLDRLDGEAGPARCQIKIEDNGIGFDEKYLDRLFKPFQRLHHQGTYEGTGIGLAICQKIAERHGGRITARSAVGQGTCFAIELPFHPPTGEAS